MLMHEEHQNPEVWGQDAPNNKIKWILVEVRWLILCFRTFPFWGEEESLVSCLSILRMGKTLHTNFQAKRVSGSFHPWCLASLSPPNTQITFFKITFIYFIGGRWACHGMHVKSDNSLWEWGLFFHHGGSGLELRSPGLSASTFTLWAVSLAHSTFSRSRLLGFSAMDFISMRESRVSGILSLRTPQEPDVVFHGCKPSTRDTEVEGGKAPAQPRLYSKTLSQRK